MDSEIQKLKAQLLDGMVEFMQPDEEFSESDRASYEQADVDACGVIIDEYLLGIARTGMTESDRLAIIQTTVEKLNSLNDECDGELIETEQREQLCAIILAAAHSSGLEASGDVTESWREW